MSSVTDIDVTIIESDDIIYDGFEVRS